MIKRITFCLIAGVTMFTGPLFAQAATVDLGRRFDNLLVTAEGTENEATRMGCKNRCVQELNECRAASGGDLTIGLLCRVEYAECLSACR